MKKSLAAFTLVELLVVIVIIGILAGIALPVFSKVREAANATKDANNLRQIGLAVRSYMTDNDGDLLDASKSFVATLYPTYISTYKIFKSPFDSVTSGDTDTTAQISYAVNGTVGTGTGATDITGMNSSKMNYPSNFLLFAPRVDTAVISGNALKFTTLFANATTNMIPKILAPASATPAKGTHRNFGQINILLGDGHTEAITYVKFANAAAPVPGNGNDDGKKRWFYDTP